MANMAKDGKSKLYSIFGGAANVAEWEKVCSKFRKVQWVKTGGKKLIVTSKKEEKQESRGRSAEDDDQRVSCRESDDY